jgi:hypothetical protein
MNTETIILIVIGVIIVVLMFAAFFYLNKKPCDDIDYAYSSNKPDVIKLTALSNKGPIPLSDTMKHYLSGGLYGEFEITEKKSKKLVIISEEYYEVTIYSLPEWNIVYSETDIHELDLSFLNPGSYSLIVHSITEIKAKLFSIKYDHKVTKPKSKIYNSGTEDLYNEVARVYDKIVEQLSENNLLPSSDNYSSDSDYKWPYMLRTQIEKIDILPTTKYIIVIGSNRHVINIKADVEEVEPIILYNEKGLIAYQLLGNITYSFSQINENIAEGEHSLPIYIYSFN